MWCGVSVCELVRYCARVCSCVRTKPNASCMGLGRVSEVRVRFLRTRDGTRSVLEPITAAVTKLHMGVV